MDKEDKILKARIEDRIRQCEDRYMMTHTEFLDLRQQSIAAGVSASQPGLRYGMYGGYPEAERCLCVFLPEYVQESSPEEHFRRVPEDDPLAVLRAELPKGSGRLSHRDYLGALMGLGIRREVTGDILVRDDGADIIVLSEMAEFICTNFFKAGRSGLRVTQMPVQELMVPEVQKEERRVSVASLRLDSVVASAFGLSRTKAAEAVKSGLVFVNGIEILKPDRQLSEGDRIVFRHKGKALLSSLDGSTAKGRVRIGVTRFK